MEKIKTVSHYLSCFIIIILIFGIISATAQARNENGTSNDATRGAEDKKAIETFQKEERFDAEKVQKNKTENITQERKKIKDELDIQKNNYQMSRQKFLSIRKQLRQGNYGEEELEITRTYLISSIDYMISHLEKLQRNLEQSNGKHKETEIATIEDRISQLQKEKEAIGSAKNLQDFRVAANSVRGIWNNVNNSVNMDIGKNASEKIDKCVNRSKIVSDKLENEIKNLKTRDVNTTNLEIKIASYNALMNSASEKNEEAKIIYNTENATSEELQKANDLLQSALKDIKNANLILKEIFSELELYRIEENNENKVKDIHSSGLNNTEKASLKNNNSLYAISFPLKENKAYPKGNMNNKSGNRSEGITEEQLED